jgi:hypothetical protein
MMDPLEFFEETVNKNAVTVSIVWENDGIVSIF